MQTSNSQRAPWGDTLKGLLIVLVVFWHVVLKTYLQVDWHVRWPIPGAWGVLSDVVWQFMMPLFLLVSGYFAAGAAARPWAAVWRPRIARFLYLYLLWTLLHAALLWTFPYFPTFVPRTVAQFVEAVTISPMNTWYLYALALYFAVAKALHRVPRWAVIGAAAALAIAVSSGAVETVSNRGSLLYDFVFFLLGLHLAPQIRRLVRRPRPLLTASAGLAFTSGFAAMRSTASELVPGVWLGVSVLGVVTVLSVAPMLVSVPVVGRCLTWLGARTLPVYLVHMPLLAIVDAALVPAVSQASAPVQLLAAVGLPVVLTAALVVVCLGFARVFARDGASWLLDLPRRPVRIPWRSATAMALVAMTAVSVSAATVVRPSGAVPQAAAAEPGTVTIGAVGDVLMHDVGHSVPADGGAGYFDAVRPWLQQDIVTGNLEQVVSDDTGHDKCGGRSDCLAFRSEPETASYLRGFDVLNMANNHTSDFGPEGYRNTRRALADNGIRATGGRDEIVRTEVGGVVVALVGFSPYRGDNRVTDLRQVRRLVRSASEVADVVVVHAHMGAEGPAANRVRPGKETMFGEDRGDPVAFAHAAVDAGADLVVGHGPHSLRGIESYRGRMIAYSLGNFGGGGRFGEDPATRHGVLLEATLRPDGSLERGRLRSVHFDDADGEPLPDPTAAAATLVDRFGARDFGEDAVRVADDGVLRLPER